MGEKLSKHSDLINVKLNLSIIARTTWNLLPSLTSPSTILLPLTAPLTSVAFLRQAWMLWPSVSLQPARGTFPSDVHSAALATSSERQSLTTKAKLAPIPLPDFHLFRTSVSPSAIILSICLHFVIFLYVLSRPSPFPHYNINSRRTKTLSYSSDGSLHEPINPAQHL